MTGILISVIVIFVIYICIKGSSSNSTSQKGMDSSSRKGGRLSNKDEHYLMQLAKIESQLRHKDDFYGSWMDREREELIRDADHALPNVILGLIYLAGIHVNADPDKAKQYFLKSIKLGSPFAYKYLAVIENGSGNSEQGSLYMEKAISLGDPEAMMMLAVYLQYEIVSEGKPPNLKRARELYTMAAKMGHEGAKHNLKLMDAAA